MGDSLMLQSELTATNMCHHVPVRREVCSLLVAAAAVGNKPEVITAGEEEDQWMYWVETQWEASRCSCNPHAHGTQHRYTLSRWLAGWLAGLWESLGFVKFCEVKL